MNKISAFLFGGLTMLALTTLGGFGLEDWELWAWFLPIIMLGISTGAKW